MQLPRLENEINFIDTKVPSGKTIGVCGWKVKEEKELLFALEVGTNTEDSKIKHIIDLLRSCTNDKAKFDSLSENDIVKVAVETRKLAKGDEIEYNYECPYCDNKFFDVVNLTKELVTKPFDVTPLTVNSRLIITFRDLDWKTTETIFKASDSSAKFTFRHIMNSIDAITLDGTLYTEFTPTETEEFIDQLDTDDMKIIYVGYEKRLSSCLLERKIDCIKCNKEIDINFGDLLSFLVL